VWLHESVKANQASEPFLFAGWPVRSAWVENSGSQSAGFVFETDADGRGSWKHLRSVQIAPGDAAMVEFPVSDQAEWVRVIANSNTVATVQFYYADEDHRSASPDKIFQGLAQATDQKAAGGLLYGLGDNRRALGVLAMDFQGTEAASAGYYELDAQMNLKRKEDLKMQQFIADKFAIAKNVIERQKSSVLVVDDQGRRWRLPLGDPAFADLTASAAMRIDREVATERDLLNCDGTFYELPAENADGFAKIRPIASHSFRIHDYASYRGMLIMTGIDREETEGNPHIITSSDGKAAVWAGVIDDLWKLGKPRGKGGPWKNTSVQGEETSDPYLIAFYDHRRLSLSHKANGTVTFTIEVDPVGDGYWMKYRDVMVEAGKTFSLDFPPAFQARWIRFKSNKPAVVTAWLEYD
jgi:hypothetical protein